MKMPEFHLYIKTIALGFLLAEIFRLSTYIGYSFSSANAYSPIWLKFLVVSSGIFICISYAYRRGALDDLFKLTSSHRYDFLLVLFIGLICNQLVSPLMVEFHKYFIEASPHLAPTILFFILIVMSSSLIRNFMQSSDQPIVQRYFIDDEEIRSQAEDFFQSKTTAESFADSVITSGADPSVVFGVDGPWGVGKTSFINLAEQRWKERNGEFIVFRFNPLRYASEPNLTSRLIQELSAVIQQKIFAPEFRPAANRYSRMLRGEAEVSFMGIKISLTKSQDTVDELLTDIDEVLKQTSYRLIIVIDDLDRLDARAVNNVLFATRQTLKLTQATYVLCYDTEVLAKDGEENVRAREFLEKFVNVKFSLFVERKDLQDFLTKDWMSAEAKLGLVPSETMIQLAAVLQELANILRSPLAPNYFPLVGNLRKLKRFINTMLLMKIDSDSLKETDFNKRDLINLILLHLNFPGVFRKIYIEETDGLRGSFSLAIDRSGGRQLFTNPNLAEHLNNQPEAARFLMLELFDAEVLKFTDYEEISEEELFSRACFNEKGSRTLERFLQYMVRYSKPEPQVTFKLYITAVRDFIKDKRNLESILDSSDFSSGQAQDKFWRTLVNHSSDLKAEQCSRSIDELIQRLPNYAIKAPEDRGLRVRSLYNMIRLLDNAGWGVEPGERRLNSPENVAEIADRIFGENKYKGNSIIERLAQYERGPLGWNDLMLLRLQCCADRMGRVHNIQTALIYNQNKDAKTTGLVDNLTIMGLRKLSQRVFSLFKQQYIIPKRNFFKDVDKLSSDTLLGTILADQLDADVREDMETRAFPAARSSIKIFVIYQLSNSDRPRGSGVGCGFYDERGEEDNRGIAREMNRYLFDTCFNPKVDESNIQYFLDYCLLNLSNPFFSGEEGDEYIATREGLLGCLNEQYLTEYWKTNKARIVVYAENNAQREITTENYIAYYQDDLQHVFDVLNDLAGMN